MADKIDMYKLKDMLKKAGATFNALGPLVGVEHEVDKAVYMEIGFFLMYLASSDGEISWDEARFISEIIGLELTPRKIAEIIKEKNIYSTEFESTPPVNFSIVVGLEKQYGEQFYPEVVPTEIMLSVYGRSARPLS